MKRTILINQEAIVELGLDLDFIDLAIFDYFKDMANSSSTIKVQCSDGPHFWVSHKQVLEDLPLLGIKSTSGIIARVGKLIDAGILCKSTDCEVLGKTLYRFGDVYDKILNTPTKKCRGSLSDTGNINNINNINQEKKETSVIQDIDKSISFITPKKEKKNGLTLPYDSDEFREWWEALKTQPKWRNKSIHALKLNLNDLSKMGERNAIESMKKTIKMGWQGVFPPDNSKNIGIHNVNTLD